jgi:hypothetical protein
MKGGREEVERKMSVVGERRMSIISVASEKRGKRQQEL